ncbi:E1-E2 ATPase-domain-containing protein [Mycena metata]|uniref:E1-E2 ATPase-domain-containing protein n=1 Tax=Mycena metata TaxID=1033252 RepID=A0AAD7JN34_9AGAR|nr:E1-E2 ATPase-domain-containing protein [Mycena metata]
MRTAADDEDGGEGGELRRGSGHHPPDIRDSREFALSPLVGTLGAPTHDEKEKQQNGGEPNYDGEEYDVLKDQAERAEKHDDEEDEGEEKRKRLWYAPWMTVAVQSDKERKIPDDWLQTNMTQGLGDNDVETRRKQFGYNELTSPKPNQFLKFISYFRGPTALSTRWKSPSSSPLDSKTGLILVLSCAPSSSSYPPRAFVPPQPPRQLGSSSSTPASAGTRKSKPALEEGNTIPADARILVSYDDKDGSKAKEIQDKSGASRKRDEVGHDDSSDNGHDDGDDGGEEDRGPSVLSVGQSAITGESLAVDKYISDVAYYTCGVKRRKCYAMASATAKQSFVGRTASLVMSSNETGHFQIVLGGIGTALLVLILVFIFIVWVWGFFRGIGIASPKENSLLVYVLVFLIIGVPVGLPCVTTTAMAVGAAYLPRRKCIVQKLTAIESLAGVDMLCSDKTGTLTANKLSLNEPYVSPGVDRDWFMTVAVLASSHNIKSLDPIDKVTIIGLKDFPGAQENLRSRWKTHKFTPFDPMSKRIEAEVEKDGKKYIACKGRRMRGDSFPIPKV